MRWSLVISLAVLVVFARSPYASLDQDLSSHDGIFPTIHSIPIISDHQYRASGAARPFVLFWISRANVGGARITRRRGADGTVGLEMLTGSDPARAPFGINRWGYIREIVRGAEAELVAIKTQTEEESIEDAKSNLHNQGANRFLVFIRERVTPRDAVAWSTVFDVGRQVSFRDLEFALGRMPQITGWQERRVIRPPGVRPGFLTALTELMDETAHTFAAGQWSPDRAPKLRSYVHRAELFDLHQDQVEVVNDFPLDAQEHVRAIRARFWIWNRQAKQSSGEYRVTYGVTGALAGVPLQLNYQPRWWLRTELTLDDTTSFSAPDP
jgi:hypothetical protein